MINDSQMSVLIVNNNAKCDEIKLNHITRFLDNRQLKYAVLSELDCNDKELIVDMIDYSKLILFLSSKESNSDINVIRTIGYAVNAKKRIIPIKFDDSQYAKALKYDIEDLQSIQYNENISQILNYILDSM